MLGGGLLGGFLAQVPLLQAPAVDYGAIAPVLVVLGAACISVLVEAFVPRSARWSAQVGLSLLTLGTAGAALGVHLHSFSRDGTSDVVTLAGTVAVDGPALFLWGTLLALSLGAVLLIADRSVEPGGAFTADAAVRPGTARDRAQAGTSTGTVTSTTMQTEVFPLFLFSLGGMMVFTAANDLLTMFIALEVLSLPLYLMCGLARRRRLLSQEAAVKYFLLGAFSSAFFLYGVALLYGYAGSVTLSAIAEA
ncbi:MAG: proton-conducting transporter membrane subunit, partial [Pseudonocardiaceae bacterium]